MRKYSTSALTKANRCVRKWAFCYLAGLEEPSGPGAAFGQGFHDRRERHLRGEIVPDLEPEGLEFLPAPSTPGLELERSFDIIIRGRWFTGRKDVEYPGVIGDHKTGTEFRYTAGKLAKDWQANLYAAETLARTGATDVELQWWQYRKACADPCERRHEKHYTEPAAKLVRLRLSRDDVAPVLEDMVALANRLHEFEEAGATPDDLPYNKSACDDFGGCPYFLICKQELFPMSETHDETISRLTKRRKGINPTALPTPESSGLPPLPPLPDQSMPPLPPSANMAPVHQLAADLAVPAGPPSLYTDDSRGNVRADPNGAAGVLARSELLTFALYHEALGRYFRGQL